MNVARSASAEPSSPACSSFANTNASIALRTRSLQRTVGTWGRTSFCSDHQSRPARLSVVNSRGLSSSSRRPLAPLGDPSLELADFFRSREGVLCPWGASRRRELARWHSCPRRRGAPAPVSDSRRRRGPYHSLSGRSHQPQRCCCDNRRSAAPAGGRSDVRSRSAPRHCPPRPPRSQTARSGTSQTSAQSKLHELIQGRQHRQLVTISCRARRCQIAPEDDAPEGRKAIAPRADRGAGGALGFLNACKTQLGHSNVETVATNPSPCSTRSLSARAPGRSRFRACRDGWRALCRPLPWTGSRGRSSRGRPPVG